MRGLLVGITGLLGAAAFWRRRRRKRGAETPAELGHEDLGPDPAEELRTKLASSRAMETETEPIAAEDTPASPLDPEVRRQSVHDRARASIDELK